jgi:hypothetical protein
MNSNELHNEHPELSYYVGKKLGLLGGVVEVIDYKYEFDEGDNYPGNYLTVRCWCGKVYKRLANQFFSSSNGCGCYRWDKARAENRKKHIRHRLAKARWKAAQENSDV